MMVKTNGMEKTMDLEGEQREKLNGHKDCVIFADVAVDCNLVGKTSSQGVKCPDTEKSVIGAYRVPKCLISHSSLFISARDLYPLKM